MLWTTSRYASAETRRAARAMASREGSAFCSRGKKTVAQLVDAARRSGEPRVMIVEERGGKPAFVSSIGVRASGKWDWLKREAVDVHGNSLKRKD